MSVQIRTLREVQEAEQKRQAEMSALMSIVQDRLPSPGGRRVFSEENDQSANEDSKLQLIPEGITDFAVTNNALGLSGTGEGDGSSTPTTADSHPHIISSLQSIQLNQNNLDAALDLSELRKLMRDALQTSNDAELVDVLQIKRQEMPDAIKSLQRAYERIAERDGDTDTAGGKSVMVGRVVRRVSLKDVDGPEGGLKRSRTVVSIESAGSSSDSSTGLTLDYLKQRDTLDREFIECGIDALTRMSRGAGQSLPSWTITKYVC